MREGLKKVIREEESLLIHEISRGLEQSTICIICFFWYVSIDFQELLVVVAFPDDGDPGEFLQMRGGATIKYYWR